MGREVEEVQEEVEEKRGGGLFAERGLLFRGVVDNAAAAATMLTRAGVDTRSRRRCCCSFSSFPLISPAKNSQTSIIY